MPEVNQYRVVLYGRSQDKPNLKAKIELYAKKDEVAGLLDGEDPLLGG